MERHIHSGRLSDKVRRGIFQARFLLNSASFRYVNSLRPTDRPIRMMERSIYSGYACFLAASKERGEVP